MKVFDLNKMTSDQKNEMFTFLEIKLVEQAVSQHLQNDEDLVLKGGVVRYDLDLKYERLLVQYANGEVWQYRCIDCGADGMLYNLVID